MGCKSKEKNNKECHTEHSLRLNKGLNIVMTGKKLDAFEKWIWKKQSELDGKFNRETNG